MKHVHYNKVIAFYAIPEVSLEKMKWRKAQQKKKSLNKRI